MIFFLNLDGTCTRQDTDHIYQGSNNASKVIAVTSISPVQTYVQAAFTLPNGLTVGYLPMAYKGAYDVKDSTAHLWELDLAENVTEAMGTVGISFNVVNSITGTNQTSYTNTFEVEYSALPLPPPNPSQSEWEQLLALLQSYAAVNPIIVEKLENFQIGTVTAKASDSGGQPVVAAQIINQDTPNRYLLDMQFTLPRGEKGDKGDPTGVPPGDTIPLMDGTGSAGTSIEYARGDHRHPSDTSKVNKSGDTMTGDLSVEKTGAMITATDGNQAVALHMGSGGINRGIYDKKNNKWLIYADTEDGDSLNTNGILKENGQRVYSPNNLPPLGYNLLVNPDSAINQRGITTLATTGYMSDRWYKILGRYVRVDIDNGTYTLTAVENLASGSWSRCLTQTIECPKALWGKQITFSLNVLIALSRSYARIQIHALNANKGTIQASPASQGLDTLGVVYESLTVPDNTVYLQVSVVTHIGTIPIGSVVKFDSPKLEIGGIATPFYVPNIAEEMPKCMRYYYRISAGADNQPALGMGQANTASLVIISGLLPIEMRVAPTAKLTGTINIRSGNKYGTATSLTAFNSPYSFQFQLPNSTNLTAGDCADIFLENNAILEFDAEI